LLLIHEMGHVIQLKREGIDASAPMFIPFLGAMVAMKEMPGNAWTEAKVGLAGPVLGSAGALAVLIVAEETDSNLLRGLAYVGFLLNLFNLVPIVPFDGGRAVAALHPAFWFLGLFMVALFFFAYHNFFALLVLLLGGYELYRRWSRRHEPGYRAYHSVTWPQRTAVAAVYLGLAAALVVGMHAAYVTPPS
jgi:Zn-dependent protease